MQNTCQSRLQALYLYLGSAFGLAETHNNSHSGALYQSGQCQKAAYDFPALFRLLLPSTDDNEEGDERHAFYDHSEGIRKPTERHMEQKYRSPWQSWARGKYSQVLVREEQRRWRP